ncbi:MAG: tRNA epoxyqueuosine(34) reductase QueG [Chitinophagaceae bacterium]|nr:tRNA epoxyqueuosine(34) reductase QueG [Oligoflexus sp.]
MGPEPTFPIFKEWLDKGYNAEMEFLKNYQDKRENPAGLMEGAKQALIFGLNYYQGDKLNAALQGSGRIAQYARLRDYHKSLKKRGDSIIQELQKLCPDLKARVMVDSAPLLERALANRTNRGFIGKNTLFIHPDKGSMFLLSEILLDHVVLEADTKIPVDGTKRTEAGGCGSCRRCQVFCPTGALDEAYTLDARKCLAYWTIEHRGVIPEKFWPWVRTYLFGCDLCQLACPYNRTHALSKEDVVLKAAEVDPFEIACMTQEYYVATFGGTPVTRAKRSGLRRNGLIALAVLEDPRLEEAIATVMPEDESVLHETILQIRARALSL